MGATMLQLVSHVLFIFRSCYISVELLVHWGFIWCYVRDSKWFTFVLFRCYLSARLNV